MKKFLPSRFPAPRKLITILIPISLFVFGWWFGLPASEKSDSTAGNSASETVWTCSMHPQIRQPAPGLCPICAMDLIPLEGGEAGGLRQVSVSPEASALLDLRVSPVVALSENDHHAISVFGRIAHNERLTTSISSRIAGRIERLFIDYTGIHVHEGDPLAELYSPEIYLAQRELIEARDAMTVGPATLRNTRRKIYEAALRKLELLEISPQEISTILTAENPSDRIIIRSPQSGRVTAKLVNQGDYIKTGQQLFTISDHSTVWLNLEVYEDQLPLMTEGLEVDFTIEAIPGEVFSGKIAYIDHLIDPLKRVAQVRVDVENPEDKMKPGMFASAKVMASSIPPGMGSENQLVTIPESAILRTGERAVVYVRVPGVDPVFEGREILLGAKLGSRQIVMIGLAEGELVVTNGAFKLDSELQLKARPSMMNPDAGLVEKPAHEAPEDLAGQWQPVLRALGRLQRAGESAVIAGEISTMKMAVEKVSTDTFQPELLGLWTEFSNRLRIDLQNATKQLPENPTGAKSIVRRSVEEAGRYLGLPSGAMAVSPVDQATAARLQMLVEAYLPVAKALAADDPGLAAAAALDFSEAADTAELREPAVLISNSTDLKVQRAAFEEISNELISQIRANGLDRIGNAYVIHCPMVGSNKGADWLSSVPQVLNPYYGASMLDCGSITETLSLGK
ncbi:efflux RND transporter periplasmic adaptor subunit [Luteolibacter sp. AS25]|uniref:efflux RND transporter periplasmic adaptor subunit n=1 Tax=Luteolibacter sp. AS25 TaxID=3135776 RepID=UPI00398BB651